MTDNTLVFFVGKPGSGKSTQAKFLASQTGWKAFTSGDLFREIAQEDTPVGRKVKGENDAGLLQPHWFAIYLYLNSLFSVPEDTGAIFDGFSRKVSEAELVVDSLRWLDRPFSVLHLVVSDEEVRRRLEDRRKVSGRVDDHVIDERLEEYYRHTEPAIGTFRNADVLIDIDGEQTQEQIAAVVRKTLGLDDRQG